MKKFLFLILFISQSWASDIIVEPYLGYQMGKFSIGETAESQDSSGLGIGVRFVYFTMGVFGGLDVHHSTLNTSGNSEESLKQNQLGLTAGFSFAIIPIRAWMTYVPSDSLKDQDSLKYSGSGVKLAIGFDPVPLLSFNIEFKTSTYDEKDNLPINDKRKVSSIFFNIGLLFGANI